MSFGAEKEGKNYGYFQNLCVTQNTKITYGFGSKIQPIWDKKGNQKPHKSDLLLSKIS
jgi:hypothetical protein